MNRAAVDRLVVEHLPTALRFAQRLTGDADLAEEVVQEALCRVLRHWRSYRADSSFATWLIKIVVNVDRDRRRQRVTLPLAEEQMCSPVVDPADSLVAQEQRARLRAAIESLPDRQREVALLCLGEGLSAQQAAEVLATTVANVHANVHLARKRIAVALGVAAARRGST
jgi:RNA polymerase sigma-70 factor (ECF subfamily)